MKAVHTFSTFVDSLTEGITKNVYFLTESLNRQGVNAVLDCPRVTVEDLNNRAIHVVNGWDVHQRAVRSLEDPEVDLVHFHVSIKVSGIFGSLAKRRADSDTPLVLHAWNAYLNPADTHGDPPWTQLAAQRVFNGKAAARWGVKGYDAAVVSSRYQAEQLRAIGFDAPIRILPNGVDVQEFRPASDTERTLAREATGVTGDPVILYFGHLSPWKGVNHFVDALPTVFEEHPEAQALISHTSYGHGEAALKERLDRHGIRDRVRLLGPSHVPNLLAAADVAVVPPIAAVGTACHPNVILEILASGVPLVASRVGSIPEAVDHGRTGLLATPADPTDISEKVRRLAGDQDFAERMGREARRDVLDRFDWNVIAREMEGFYQDLVAGDLTATTEVLEVEGRR